MNKTTINWTAMRAAMTDKKASRAQPAQAFTAPFLAAAFRASFSLEEMGLSGEEAKKLLQACEVVNDHGAMKWQMKSSERVKVMQSLGSLAAMKQHLPKGEKTGENTLQRMLSDYVQGTAKPLQEQGLQELGASYQVAGWLQSIAPADIPEPIVVQAQLKVKELTTPFRNLTKYFQGREDELEHLRGYNEQKPLLIHGLGGAGKSTLISKFILEHLEGSPAGHIPFIYLDFDRPGVSIREPLTLLFEGLRQLILQFPKEEKVLEEYRRGWENDLLGTKQSNVRGYSQSRGTGSGERRHYLRDFDTIWNDILSLRDVPLLFVLDSFEEVQYRATLTDLVELNSFLHQMSDMVKRFRAVISGRSELPDLFLVNKLFIGSFDEKAAIGYLTQKGITDDELSARIFENIGGNPLNLTLAASVVLKEMEKGDRSHDWLLLKMEGESIQELLFRRNMEHIHKEKVRQLAFPGLTVRFISPPVIQHILAAPCGLGEIGEEEAIDLFDELKRETFLVNIDEQGRFRFRPDLRKLLIDLVQKQEPERSRQIHNLAVSFYEKEDKLEANAEHVYHALQRGDDPNTLGHLVQPELQPYLENSLSEFSPNNYLFLASIFNLEVPEEVRQRADLGYWEEKMASELEGFLEQGQVSSFPSMLLRLKEKTDRSANSPLRFLEASFYELAGDLKLSYDKARVALRDAEKYLVYERQGQILELLARIEARQGGFAEAQEYTERGIAMAEQQNQPLMAIGLTFDLMQLLSRQGKSFDKTLEGLLVYVNEKESELEKLFLDEYRMQKFVPSYNDPGPTLTFLRTHLVRFVPSNVWEDKKYPGSIAGWLEKTVNETMSERWLNAAEFQGFIEKTKTLARDLDQLEKHSKARLDVFLREIIPPSVYDISVYDLVVFAEIEGRIRELTESKGKGYQQEVFQQERSVEMPFPDEGPAETTGAEPPEEEASAAGSLNIFMSYVKEDEDLKKELDKHLALLRRTPGIRMWDMEKISAGDVFQEQINDNLRSAHIILLLVSADYMSNQYVYENEMMFALKRQQEEGVMVVPIYLRPTYMEESPLANLKGLPRDNQAVSNFKDRDEAYNEIAVGVRRLVDRMMKA